MATPRTDPEDSTGEACPNCGADTLDIGTPHPGSDQVVKVDLACLTCRATWTEHYGLIGYDNLEIPKTGESAEQGTQ